MNLSVFKNPLVIGAVIGAGIFGGVGTYVGMDCSQAREVGADCLQTHEQRARQVDEDAAFERFMKRSPKTDPKKYEENPFNFEPTPVPTRN